MEISTCEEYVLRELENCQNALAEAKQKIEQLELEIEFKDRLISEFKFKWLPFISFYSVGDEDD